jgi:hypothetical protein
MLKKTNLHQEKQVMFSPKVLDKKRFGRPVTRSSTRRQIHVEETRPEMHVQCLLKKLLRLNLLQKKRT